MKKKLLALILAGVMVLSLAACGGTKDDTAPADTDDTDQVETQEPAESASYTVGICQLAPHPALDAATEGFKDALTEAFGDAVTFLSLIHISEPTRP